MTLQEKLDAFQRGTEDIEDIHDDQSWVECKEDAVVDYIRFLASIGFKKVALCPILHTNDIRLVGLMSDDVANTHGIQRIVPVDEFLH